MKNNTQESENTGMNASSYFWTKKNNFFGFQKVELTLLKMKLTINYMGSANTSFTEINRFNKKQHEAEIDYLFLF